MVVKRAGHAKNVGLFLLDCIDVIFDRVVDAKVDDLEAGPLHHHRHKVLADVVDVALHRSDYHLAHAGRAGFRKQGLQDRHPRLHGIGGQKNLGHEQDAIAKVVADNFHAANQGFGQNAVGFPAAFQKDVGAFLDLFFQDHRKGHHAFEASALRR